MADYTITFARSARQELEALDAAVINRIFPKIEALATAPRPLGCRKLTKKTCGASALVIIG